MLAVKSYPQDYVDQCRALIASRIAAFDDLGRHAGHAERDALFHFEPLYFNDLVVVLEGMFVNRMRGQEAKGPNPLGEVRILSESLLLNGGILGEATHATQDPKASVLGLRVGEEIKLRRADLEKLAAAYFAEIEARFGED